MLYNITTGYNGLQKTPQQDIVVFVTSLHTLREQEVEFVFTDRHAYVQAAQFSGDMQHLDRIDWEILRRRNFNRDPDDPGKCERYQAESLIHRLVPVSALLAIANYGPDQAARLSELVASLSLETKVITRREWYF